MRTAFLLLFLFTLSVHSQNISVDNNRDFEKALQFYKSHKYSDALSLFKLIESRKENNSKLTASSLFICKILQEQKKYSESESALKSFLEKYPTSRYLEEANTLLINNYIQQQKYLSAFNNLINLLNESNSVVYKNENKNLAEKIALYYLKSSDIGKTLEQYENEKIEPFLILLEGKLLLQENDKLNAGKKFSEITSNFISSEEYLEALNLKKNIRSTQNDESVPAVGVLISLTDSNDREIISALEVLEGMKFAFHKYNSTNTDKIGLIVKDIKRNNELTNQFASEFIENGNIRCILGPIFSDDVRAALKEIDRSDICLISPTATDDDLIQLSENFFQANPSLTSRGKTIAQYLYFVENKRNLAVLNSIDGYSPLLAASFIKEFEKLGGTINAKETYKSKSFDLSEQISRISVLSNVIEGIYAPISDASDAGAILSQMVQNGLNVNLYGNQDWFLGKGFESSSTLSNRLTFDSDYFIDYNDPELKDFSTDFKKVTGLEVNRNVLYGYDTAKYLLTVIRNINPTRKNIRYKMESGISVNGFHNNISFSSQRNNKYTNIIRYKDGIFELVEKYRSND
ncbi:MAG: ABC transporter substrate-binding protein [Ignavibacterium sp.]|jgi:branched-chain amino acid transport system substrate-binding protein|nr:ABC transporter substrate-binding protein [Ignavibacterium sp.]